MLGRGGPEILILCSPRRYYDDGWVLDSYAPGTIYIQGKVFGYDRASGYVLGYIPQVDNPKDIVERRLFESMSEIPFKSMMARVNLRTGPPRELLSTSDLRFYTPGLSEENFWFVPKETREAIRTLLVARKRAEIPIGLLPAPLLFYALTFYYRARTEELGLM